MLSSKRLSLRLCLSNMLLNYLLFIFNGEYMVETTAAKMKIEVVLRFPDI